MRRLRGGGFLVANSGHNLFGQFGRNADEAVVGASVVLGFFHYFVHGRATSYKVAIDANIFASQNLCHFGLRQQSDHKAAQQLRQPTFGSPGKTNKGPTSSGDWF